MSKLAVFGIVALVLLPTVNTAPKAFAKYKSVEAYEVRPGILMLPRYAADGQVCEIVLEQLHILPDKVRLGYDLSQKDIDQIFEEIVPDSERGPQPSTPLEQVKGLLGGYFSGRAMISNNEYQNISIKVYSQVSGDLLDSSKTPATIDQVAASLKWKNRDCQ